MRFAVPLLALLFVSCGPARTGFDVNAAGIVRSGDNFETLQNRCSVTFHQVGSEPATYGLAFTDYHYPDPQMAFVTLYSQATGEMIDWRLTIAQSVLTSAECPTATVTTVGNPRFDGWLDVRATFPATGCGDPGTSTIVGHINLYGCPVVR